MKEYFVPYEIAKELKAIGFDEPCLGYYFEFFPGDPVTLAPVAQDPFTFSRFSTCSNKQYHQHTLNHERVAAPMYDQVLAWFEKKEIILQPILFAQFEWESGWGYELTYRDKKRGLVNSDENDTFLTRRDTLNNGFERAVQIVRYNESLV